MKHTRKLLKLTRGLQRIELQTMLLPAMLLVLIFNLIPLFGLIIAFVDYDYLLGGIKAIFQSEWVGLDNFKRIFAQGGDGVRIIYNTVYISSLKIIFGLIVPIVFSLLLNELRIRWFKRFIQTVIYMPNFISWIVFASIIKQMLVGDGTLNLLLQNKLQIDAIPFLSSNDYFVGTLITTEIWKSFGFGTVIYLAVLSSISPTLYEAARIDGASRFQCMRFITIPSMYLIIMLNMVLSLQGILSAGFEQVFTLYSPVVYETGDILDTYIYRISFDSALPDYSFATAIGLFKSLVSAVLIVVSYKLLKRWTGYNIL